jgi:hypothetical protein
MRASILALLVALAVSATATAQTPVVCPRDRTVAQCRQLFRHSAGVQATSATVPDSSKLAAGVEQRLNAKAVGLDLPSSDSRSAIRDFLPKFAAAFLQPVTGGDPGDLGVNANLPLNDGTLFTLGFTGQVGLVVHKADISSVVLDSIPATLRSAVEPRLRERLEFFDDVSLSGSGNLENRIFGRSMQPHRGEIEGLATEILHPGGNRLDAYDEAGVKFDAFLHSLDARLRDGDITAVRPEQVSNPNCRVRSAVGAPGKPSSGDVRLDCLTDAMQDSVEQWISFETTATARWIAGVTQRVRSSGFLHVAQLLNNQPQVNGTLEYRSRAAVVGANAWTGRVRWESGFANLNGYRRFCASRPELKPADCLQRYTTDRRVAGSLARADRVWAQFDWTRRNAWHVSQPGDSLRLRLNAASTYAVSAGYGGYVSNAADDENRDRLDVQGKFDIARGDPVRRRNRFVASADYTRHLADRSTAVLGFTYANRPEFLGDVDHRLRANLGVTYKISRSPAAEADK